jgi:hypothetical protein
MVQTSTTSRERPYGEVIEQTIKIRLSFVPGIKLSKAAE